MDFLNLIRKDIQSARLEQLKLMEIGAFRKDLDAYNESVGFLRGLQYITECVEDLLKRQDE